MNKRFPFRTAIAGLTALALAAPVITPANTSILAAAVAQTQDAVQVTGPNTVNIKTPASFTATVPGASTGAVQFFLDGVLQDTVNVNEQGVATATITPKSHGDHTLVTRYVIKASGTDYNVNPDGETTFNTPFPQKYEMNDSGRQDEQGTYGDFKINNEVHSLTDPLELEAGDEYSVYGRMTVGRNGSKWPTSSDFNYGRVYEVGFNPPVGSQYVDGTAVQYKAYTTTPDPNMFVGTRANQDGVTTTQSGNGVYGPEWGKPAYSRTWPKVNSGYVGLQNSRTYDTSKGARYEITAKFTAPDIPGIHVPEYAAFKYRDNLHVLIPMNEAAFRIAPKELPERNELPAAAETNVTLKPDQTLTAGKAGSIEATVGPDGATGTVEFTYDGGQGTAEVSNGVAKLENVTFDTLGLKEIQLSFTPDSPLWKPSNGEGTVEVKEPAQTTLSVTADQATVTDGTQSTLTATVTPDNATGTVQFKNNGTNIGNPVTVNGGTATLTQTLPVGTNSITAEFTPANTNDFTTATAQATTITVNPIKVGTTIAYTGKPTHPYGGTKYYMEATVTDADGQPVNGGKVEFALDGTALSPQIEVKNGKAVYDKTFNQPGQEGPHTVALRYIPAANSKYNAATTTQDGTFTITKAANTTLKVTADQATVTDGTESTLTATVTPDNATGTVQFKNNGTNIGNPVTVNGGTATLTQTLPVGTNTITAEFTPANTNDFTTATAQATTITVNKKEEEQQPPAEEAKTTDLTLNATQNVKVGDTVTITAMTNPADAEGTVEFFNGKESLGKKDVTNGTATADFTPETAGSYDITAVFTPADAAKFTGSQQTTKVEVKAVTPPATENTVPVIDATQPVRGGQYTVTALNARVKPGTEGIIKFTLTDGTEIGAAPINPDGTATFNYPFTEPGAYAIQARYVAPDGTVSAEASDVFTVTVASKERTGSSERTDTSKPEKSSIDGPSRPWIITGITLAVTALAAGVGFFFLNNPTVKNFLAQFGIRY